MSSTTNTNTAVQSVGMRNGIVVLTAAVVFLCAGSASATGNGRVVIYGGGGAGKVIFDGYTHAAAGFSCYSCHPPLFAMSRKTLIRLEDHSQPKACFQCHNGQRAFNACEKCHRK